jgi:hypothetical protein
MTVTSALCRRYESESSLKDLPYPRQNERSPFPLSLLPAHKQQHVPVTPHIDHVPHIYSRLPPQNHHMAPRGDIPEQPREACRGRSGYQSLLPKEQSGHGATGRDGSDSQVSKSKDINLGPPQYNTLPCLRTDRWNFAFAGAGSTMIQHPPIPTGHIGRSKWSKRTVPISPPGTSTQRNKREPEVSPGC